MEVQNKSTTSFFIKDVCIADVRSRKILRKDILVKDRLFKGVVGKEQMSDECRIIDGRGNLLITDTIDIHVHLRDPGHPYKETLDSGLKASAKGGLTKVVAMPNTSPVVDDIKIFESILNRAGNIRGAKLYQACSLTKDLEGKELNDLKYLQKNGINIFSDDGKAVIDSKLMMRALQMSKGKDVVFMLHSQSDLIPPEDPDCEILGINRDIILSEITNNQVHIQHVSTGKGLDIIIGAKKRGVKVSCEVCPHHLFLNSSNTDVRLGLNKVNPPIREKEDSGHLLASLINGEIEVLASDHAPHSIEEKSREYDKAPFGLSGVETLIPVSYTELVKKRGMDLFRYIGLISKNPLKIAKIDSNGLKVNTRPSFTLIDTEKEYIFKSEDLVSKGRNNLFIGYKAGCQINLTVVDGEIVWQNL